MNTKEIVKTIENLTGLCFEISINDNQTEVTSTFNPEKINYEYFNVCNELESYFTELYLDSNNLILERILYLLNDGLKLWNRLKKESFNINLNFENKELKNLETELTDAELLRVAEIKIYYIQNLISKIENLTGSPKAKALPPQPIIKQKPELNEKLITFKNSETDTEKYTAKHYLLAYLFECNAKGESYPIGNKKELERIGNERMGAGKGNRFYKVFNEVINKDLNAEKNLFEIGGEYWRKAVIELSKAPELVENYLQSKQL